MTRARGRGRSGLRVAAVVAALAVTAAGCSADPDASSAGSGSGQVPSAPGSSPPQAPDPALRSYYRQDIEWSACGKPFECGRLAVPVDYDDPDGDQFFLAVIRLPADPEADRIGSLVINPGGPGGSGLDYARRAGDVITEPVRARYDIVGFDPRGVGQSQPIDCLSDSELDDFLSADASPDSEQEVDALVNESRDLAQGCQQRSGDVLAYLGTRNVARDLDVLRAVLGDEKLHYLGKSYGTYIGALYADQFPDRVGRVVLDGALDPTLSGQELTEGQARGFELAYDNFIDDCLTLADCPLGDSTGQAKKRVDELLADLDDEPLRTADPDRDLNQALAVLGVVVAMYDEMFWPVLRQAFQVAFGGDGTLLLALSDAYTMRMPSGAYKNNSNEVIYAVNCLDHPDDSSVQAVKAQLPELRRLSPTFGEFIGWGELPCGFWPVDSDVEPEPVNAPGAAPILVVGTTGDPATPYEWAQGLAEQLDSGVLLTNEGDGHTAYARSSACIDEAVEAYLLDGDPPADGTRCE